MGGKAIGGKYVADFETTTDPNDCRVWLWAIVEVLENPSIEDVSIGTDIRSFMETISMFNSTIYFHNLKFDGGSIIDWLLRNGYRHTISYARKGQFQTLIDKANKFYTITVKWKSGHRTEFRDSYKKIPMTVARAAKAYHLNISKLHIDYDEFRPVGHVPTDDEREYIANDVLIISSILWQQMNEGMTKLTVGADSLSEYKRLNKVFDRMFPVLNLSMDSDIRLAYRGGWTYCDPRTAKQVVGPGSVYDVNSLYPSVMYDSLLPYGSPIWFDGFPQPDDKFPLYVMSITFTAKLKKDHVACIQIKNHSIFVSTEYVREVNEPITLCVTNVDLELWEEQYDLDILSYNGGWRFMGQRDMFKEYIDKWMHVKENSEGGLREIAKLHLNSLYGKFATNPDVTSKVPILDKDKNLVRYVMGEPDMRNPVYTAMGAFITAYARRVTITAAQKNFSVFLYADTDSLHLNTLDEPVGIDVHASRLGAWKKEYEFDYGMFWRAKTYIERRPDNLNEMGNTYYEVHIAGLPRGIAETLTISDFKKDARFGGKLLQKVVPGGIVLVSTEFQLKS